MFVALFASFVNFAFIVGGAVLVYQIFLSDWIAKVRAENKEKASAKASVDKIALVKLVSDDPKKIEDFISSNANYLSTEIVQKLVDRIESLKFDKMYGEDSLKKRIDDLVPPSQSSAASLEAEELEEMPTKKRVKR